MIGGVTLSISGGELTVVGRVVAVRMVHHGGRAGVDGLERPGELTEEQVLRGEQNPEGVAAGHVFNQGLVRVPALELCLPQVVMSINEARAYNFAPAVNDSRAGRGLDRRSDLGDDRPLHEHVSDGRDHPLVLIVDEERAALQNDCARIGHCDECALPTVLIVLETERHLTA